MPCSYRDQALLKLLVLVFFLPAKNVSQSRAAIGLEVPCAKGHRGQRESWDCLGSTADEGGGKQQRVTPRAWERVCRRSLVRAAHGNERQAGKGCCQ